MIQIHLYTIRFSTEFQVFKNVYHISKFTIHHRGLANFSLNQIKEQQHVMDTLLRLFRYDCEKKKEAQLIY
jgi:hypothetical protein